MQLIYTRKTQCCYSGGIPFSDWFDMTHSKNQRNNETLAIQHLDNIIIPFFEAMREKLGLPGDQKCLLVYDVFKAQTTDKYCEHLDQNNIAYVQVPPNLTNIFQPLDLIVNEFAKSSLKSRFQEWYARELTNDLDKEENVDQIDIDAKLSKMKAIHGWWLINL